MDRFTIDELARAAGTKVSTIRLYQQRGLLPPPAIEGRVGYYDDAAPRAAPARRRPPAARVLARGDPGARRHLGVGPRPRRAARRRARAGRARRPRRAVTPRRARAALPELRRRSGAAAPASRRSARPRPVDDDAVRRRSRLPRHRQRRCTTLGVPLDGDARRVRTRARVRPRRGAAGTSSSSSATSGSRRSRGGAATSTSNSVANAIGALRESAIAVVAGRARPGDRRRGRRRGRAPRRASSRAPWRRPQATRLG